MSRKGQTLNDYHKYVKQPGNKGNELALHTMACVANIFTIGVTKTGVWSTFNGDVSDAGLVISGEISVPGHSSHPVDVTSV